MNAPRPLTSTPAARLDWREDGAPLAKGFDDIYFSADGGLEETRQVFLRGCGLPESWEECPVFVIGELGFGTGLNFLATLDVWRKTARPDQHLYFISVEAFPFDKAQLKRALTAFPALKDLAGELISRWPGRVRGTHLLTFGNISLHLVFDDIGPALTGLDAQVNAWFLDGFSPAKNPEMWSEAVCAHLARLSAPGTRLATFTVAGSVRRGLAGAGFTVEKMPGFGRKRERLEARFPGTFPLTAKRPINPLIVGGGIAGAGLVHAFARRGIKARLLEPYADLKTAASGNPAGILMPKLDLQDRPESRFYNAAYLYARQLYARQLNESHDQIYGRGVLQMAGSEKEAERFEKIDRYQALPTDEMALVSHTQAEVLAGCRLSGGFGGLYAPSALSLSPKGTVLTLRQAAEYICDKAVRLTRSGKLWQVETAAGVVLETKALFVCNGANIRNLLDMDVRFTRGQLCWGQSPYLPERAVIAGHYAVPFLDNLLLGATHAHAGAGEDIAVRPEDTQDLLAAGRNMFGPSVLPENVQARTSVRVTTKNTLPIATQIDGGLFVLSGLGSRGFMLAPLLGEYLVAQALGLPSPLDKATQKRFVGAFVA